MLRPGCVAAVLAHIFALFSVVASSLDSRDLSSLGLQEHPVEGVIALLGSLEATARAEGNTEEASYRQYDSWCTSSIDELDTAIADEKHSVSALSSRVSGLKEEIIVLDDDISYLGRQIEKQHHAAAKAKKIREDANRLYQEEQENLHGSIGAVGEAADVMKELVGGSSASFLQKTVTSTSGSHHASQGEPAAGAESGASYASHSGGILDTLDAMDQDFTVDQEESVEDQTHAQNEYNRAKKARDDALAAAGSAKEEKEGMLHTKKSDVLDAEADQKLQEEALAADSASLASTTLSCDTTKKEFQERTELRKGEIMAMETASKILTQITKVRNPDEHVIPGKHRSLIKTQVVVNGTARSRGRASKDRPAVVKKSKWLEAMAKARKARLNAHNAAFVFIETGERKHELRSSKGAQWQTNYSGATRGYQRIPGRPESGQLQKLRGEAIVMVRKLANSSGVMHKAALSQLVASLEANKGPFDKFINMVQKMIFHLMAEQKDEDSNKQWCDMETEKSSELKQDKEAKLNALVLKLEQLHKTVPLLAQDIQNNNDRVVEVNEHMITETSLRKEHHKELKATIRDAEEAQKALQNAVEVLTAFYKKSGMIAKEPWEFVQTDVGSSFSKLLNLKAVVLPDEPEKWDSSYTGVADPNNGPDGVLTLLHGVGEKFAAMRSEAEVQDATDQKDYDSDMADSKVELAELRTDSLMRSEKKSMLQEKIEGLAEAKRHLEREVSAATTYIADLKKPCDTGENSYEDRKAARASEIEGLKGAEAVLESAVHDSRV